MSKADIIRAWKDPFYRSRLTAEERAQLPDHPSALVELEDEQLQSISGAFITTARNCTEFSFNQFRGCCPS